LHVPVESPWCHPELILSTDQVLVPVAVDLPGPRRSPVQISTSFYRSVDEPLSHDQFDHVLVDSFVWVWDVDALMQGKLVQTIVANYVLWPAAHFINFRFVPSEQRIAYNNVISVTASQSPRLVFCPRSMS
jgi:hypothetical protein